MVQGKPSNEMLIFDGNIWEQLYGFPMSMMCQAHHLMVSPILSSQPTPGQSGEPHEPHHAVVRRVEHGMVDWIREDVVAS